MGVSYEWVPRDQNKIADILSKTLQPKYQNRELTHEEVQNLINKNELGTL
jgi:hypothetical protein